MKTYIANCTLQNQMINFRLPEARKVTSMTIPMGRQKEVGDFVQLEIDAMIAALGPYGLVSVDDIGKSRTKITYVYSTKGPVPAEKIARAIDHNKGHLRAEGKKRREEAAIATNVGMNTEETPLNRLEMSVEQISDGSIPADEPIGEGFRIDNTLSTSENKRPRPRRSGS